MTINVKNGQILCGSQVLSAATIYALVFGDEQWKCTDGLVTAKDLEATGLTFSEYPCTPGIHLRAKIVDSGPEIIAGLMGKENESYYPVSSPADYLIVGSRWVPLPKDTESSMSELLRGLGMDLGPISMGQYLRILQTPIQVFRLG